MKNSNDIIENRYRVLPVCSAVPQTTASQRVRVLLVLRLINVVQIWRSTDIYSYTVRCFWQGTIVPLHVMVAYGEVEIHIRSFLTSALHEGEWSALRSGRLLLNSAQCFDQHHNSGTKHH